MTTSGALQPSGLPQREKNINRPMILLGVILLVVLMPAMSQNLDLNRNRSVMRYGGTAFTHLSLAPDLTGLDINPAALSSIHCLSLSIAQRVRHFDYALDNLFQNHSVMNYRWSELLYDIDHALIAIPLTGSMTIGGGLVQKMNGFESNQYTAVTRSVLFDARTQCRLSAIALSFGIQLQDRLSAGMTIYRYTGGIRSSIRGDRHGLDSDKWATLVSACSGYSLRGGIQYQVDNLLIGLAIESSCALDITTEKTISHDRKYEKYFPSYHSTLWNLPAIVTAGCSYQISDRVLTSFDVSTSTYHPSDVQLSLYEYAGRPSWGTVTSLRAGIAFAPNATIPLWLRFGYARIPQSYADQTALGGDSGGLLVIDGYSDTNRLIQHMISLDVKIVYAPFTLQPGIEYSTITWNRTITGSTLLMNTYHEKLVSFSLRVGYSLPH